MTWLFLYYKWAFSVQFMMINLLLLVRVKYGFKFRPVLLVCHQNNYFGQVRMFSIYPLKNRDKQMTRLYQKSCRLFFGSLKKTRFLNQSNNLKRKKKFHVQMIVVHGHNYQLRLNEQKAQLLCERLQYTIFCIYQPFLQFLFVKWVRMFFKKAIKSILIEIDELIWIGKLFCKDQNSQLEIFRNKYDKVSFICRRNSFMLNN